MKIKSAEEFFARLEKKKIAGILAVLKGEQKTNPQIQRDLLELGVRVGVCGLYDQYKEDVISTFSLEQLQDIVDGTEPFREFSVEHIYKTALGL